MRWWFIPLAQKMQGLIDQIRIFYRDRDRDENFQIKVCLTFFDQGLIDPDRFFDRDHDRV